MREVDWSSHELGSPQSWPVTLQTVVGICLASRFPMSVWWGPSFTLLYNNAYINLLGSVHPSALARSGEQACAEIWGQLGPTIARVFADGAARAEDLLMSSAPGLRADEEVLVTFSFSPIFGAGGAVDGVFCTCVENTDAGIQERFTRAAIDEARAAARAKDDFLSLLGHELRNPLSALSTTVQTLLMTAPSEQIELMERAVRQLTRLVDDLLDISRLSRGKVQLKRERIELAEVVDRAMERVAALLHQRRTQVFLRVPRSGLQINCDADRLAQGLANVLANASKFSEPGAKVSLEASRVTDRVRVVINDTGSGIDPSRIATVFDPFADVQKSDGLGIGLAIARNLVELHHGMITLESAGAGRGTTCTIVLPVDATEGVSPPTEPTVTRSRRRVLLVEDNHDTAMALKHGLEQLGYQVVIAHNGPVALTVARSFRPDVALLDIGLPVMDGWELARRLRELEVPSRELHFVAVTARDQDADRKRSEEAGFADHLVKPIDLAKLERVVESLPELASD